MATLLRYFAGVLREPETEKGQAVTKAELLREIRALKRERAKLRKQLRELQECQAPETIPSKWHRVTPLPVNQYPEAE